MKCTKCGLREATTEVLQRHNNKIEKMYLCDACAKDFRPDIDFDDFDILGKLMGSPMGLVSNLSKLLETPHASALICPDCKTTSEEFMNSGFVGCPRCYEVFEPLITQTVRQLQQSDRHVGKSPYGAADFASEEKRLKAELQAAIDGGQYGRASELSNMLQRLYNEHNREGGI